MLDQYYLLIDCLVVNLHPQMHEIPSMSRFWQSWMFFQLLGYAPCFAEAFLMVRGWLLWNTRPHEQANFLTWTWSPQLGQGLNRGNTASVSHQPWKRYCSHKVMGWSEQRHKVTPRSELEAQSHSPIRTGNKSMLLATLEGSTARTKSLTNQKRGTNSLTNQNWKQVHVAVGPLL